MDFHNKDWACYPDPNFTSDETIFEQYSMRSPKPTRKNHERGPIVGLGARSVVRSTNLSYVLKETSTDYLQVDLLTRYAHPNIIGLKSFWVGPSIDRTSDELSLFMILESASHILLTRPTRENQARVIYGLVRAVLFLHRNGATHNHIHLDHALMGADGQIKLIGFGSATYRNRGTVYRTTEYTPPDHSRDLQAADLWALGITIFSYLLDGIAPFNDTEDITQFTQWHRSWLSLLHIHVKWHPLLIWLLEPDPHRRMANSELVYAVYYHSIGTEPGIASLPRMERMDRYDSTMPNVIWKGEAQVLLQLMRRIRLDAEAVFLAMDLFYRTLEVYRGVYPMPHLRLAYMYLATQLGAPREFRLPNDTWTAAHIRNIAGSIVMFLKGVVYPPNLFTGIRDPHVLSERVVDLVNPERYHLKDMYAATLRPLRIPISLL